MNMFGNNISMESLIGIALGGITLISITIMIVFKFYFNKKVSKNRIKNKNITLVNSSYMSIGGDYNGTMEKDKKQD